MKQLVSDIVVISAGTAGLPAAVTAAEGGARVIVFEKTGHTGGQAHVGGQIAAVGSAAQKRKGVTLTSDEIFKLHMDYVHWRADARLVKTFYDESGKTMDWFENLGVQVTVMDGPGKYAITHGARGWIGVLSAKAKDLGVQILFKTPVKKILKEGSHIVGVIAQDPATGEEIQAKAKAVIVATGGFGANPEMIKQYTGFEWGKDLYSFRIPACSGDGIRMAWDVGAARSEMMMQLIFALPTPHHGATGTSPEFAPYSQIDNIMVNLAGERFINEEMIKDTTFGGNNIARQKDHCAFMIFDADTRDYYDENGAEYPGSPGGIQGGRKRYVQAPSSPGRVGSDGQSEPGDRPQMTEEQMKKMRADSELIMKETGLDVVMSHDLKTSPVEGIDSLTRKALANGYKHFFIADSLEELCSQTGIYLEGLKTTLAEYNGFCEKGHDDTFGKDPKRLRPVKNPGFYACRYYPSAYGTLGGIKINYKTEALDNDGRAIPGLYAAGIDAAAIYGDSYTRFLYGNTQGFSINSGRIAGKRALEYIKIAND